MVNLLKLQSFNKGDSFLKEFLESCEESNSNDQGLVNLAIENDNDISDLDIDEIESLIHSTEVSER